MKYNYLIIIILIFFTSCNTTKTNNVLIELTKKTENYNQFKLNNFKNEMLSVENTARIDDTFKNKYQDNFLDNLNSFKKDLKVVLQKKYPTTKILLDSLFKTEPINISKDKKENWLTYQFANSDNITDLAKLTLIQSNVVAVKTQLMLRIMGDNQFSENAYKVDVVLEKSKYYPGEKVKGKLFINKSAENLLPKNVYLNGKEIGYKFIKEGEVDVEMNAPKNVGEYPLDGNLTISQGNLDLTLFFNKTYSVIKKSESNDLSTEQGGSSDANRITNNISKVKVVANLGHPEVVIRGKVPNNLGVIKLTRGSFKVATIDAIIPNSDESLSVSQFSFKAPNQPTIKTYGNGLNRNAINIINKAKRGTRFMIFNVKLRLKSNPKYRLKTPKLVSVEIID